MADLTDRGTQITVREATQLRSDARVGDLLTVNLPTPRVRSGAIQAAKQVLIQRVREAERDQFDDYHERVGEVVTGIVQQVDRGSVIVKSSTALGRCSRRASRSAATAIGRANLRR